jgi:hypothetical protein
MTDSDVETGLDAYIGNRRLRMDLELATATRGRVQLVHYKNSPPLKELQGSFPCSQQPVTSLCPETDNCSQHPQDYRRD